MRIDCPGCHVVYQLPAKVARGRTVRCGRCRHEFVVDDAPAEDEPEMVELDEAVRQIPLMAPRWPPPEAGVPRRRADDFFKEEVAPAPPPPRGRMSARIALAVSVLALCVLGYAAYHWRDEAMVAWPPSQRLFQILGAA